ncbi:MAG TPA: pseudouridine synthase, partial [Firmicutes bacterium]|nr:pseudouridine synthase [Bacillota bacterium]
ELARAGREIPRPARRVMVYRAEMVDFWPGPCARALIDLECSHGTYVRTWCADLGDKLGVGGYMGFLLRTRVGEFLLEESRTLEEIAEAATRGNLGTLLEPMGKAVSHLPAVVMVRNAAQLAVGHIPTGSYQAPAEGSREGQRVRVMGPGGELLAVARWMRQGGDLFLHPEKVLVPAPDRARRGE